MFELTRSFKFPREDTASAFGRDSRSGLWRSVLVFLLLCMTRIIGLTHQNLWYHEGYRIATEVIRISAGVPVFMVEGQPKLIEHYGASVIDASDVSPHELSDILRRQSEYAPEIEWVVNEYRGFRWDHSPGPTRVLASTYACALDRHLAFIDVFACRLKTPVLISGESYRSSDARSGTTYAQ